MEQIDYPFEEEDNENNLQLVLPENANSERPVVKAGRLEKLIERLTYEKYPGIIITMF